MTEFNWPFGGSDSAYPGLLYPGGSDLAAGPETTSSWGHALREAKAEPTQPDVDANAARWIGQRPAAPLP